MMDALVDADATFAPSFARHYVLSEEEARRAFGFLGIAPPPGGRGSLHIAVASFIEAAIAQVAGTAPEKQVRDALARTAKRDPAGLEGPAGAVVAATVTHDLDMPCTPADAVRYVEEVTARAEHLLDATRAPRGAPPDRALDALLAAVEDIAQAAGAPTGLGGNDTLDSNGTPPPFLAFVEEVALAACERAGLVLDARPRQPEREACREYFAGIRALTEGGSRRLADAIRRARKRSEVL